tara:strand:- start:20 stop:520 length:501 start_codon:yes stop_codon:yes gene_type:complete
MEERETKWTPMKALGRVSKRIDSLGIPIFDPKLPEYEGLEFADLSKASDKDLEKFLTMYGGYNAFLQTKVADIEAVVGAFEASFNEGYSRASYKLVAKHEKEGRKKATKDELKGEIMVEYDALTQLRRDIIEQTAELKRLRGLLDTYKEAYGTVSRVVTIRTTDKY